MGQNQVALSIIATAILTLTFMSFTFRGKHRKHDSSSFTLTYLTRKLNLTEEQKVKIGMKLRELDIQKIKLNNLKEEYHQRVEELLLKDTMNQESIKLFYEQMVSEMTVSNNQIISNISEMHKTLTPEQRQKLFKLLSKSKRQHFQ